MTTVLLTHPPDKLEQYYGPRAVAALEAIADVRFNPETRERVFTNLQLIERESVASPPSPARGDPTRPSKKAKP